jgi:hypothetical protein
MTNKLNRPVGRLFIVILIWIAAIPSLARGDSFDLLSFSAPATWEKAVVENDHVLYTGYNASRTAFCQLWVYASRESAGSPVKDFENLWNVLIVKNYKAAYEGTPTVKVSKGWTAVAASTHVVVKNIVPFASLLISFTGSGRVSGVVINVSDVHQFSTDVDAFIKSLAPIDPPVAAQAAPSSPATVPAAASGPSTGADALRGMWQGLGTTKTTTGVTNAAGTGYASISTSSSLKLSRIVFFPDGNFCGVIPQVGFDGLDLNAERAKEPYYWGTYTFSDGKGNITIHGTNYPFELRGNKVYYGGMEFMWHYPSADGRTFAGTFTAEKDPGRYKGPEPTLTFTLDGRFTDNGAIYWMRHVRGYTEDQSDKLLGSGTYSIRNYTMIFKYDDGRQIKLAFVDMSGTDPKNPAQVRFNVMILDRK